MDIDRLIAVSRLTDALSRAAIAVTAYAREEDREKILAGGFGYNLAKPVDPVVMARTVREAARR